jgi:predicted amidohydrolase
MHVVLCQPDIAWEDKPTTFAGIRALLEGIDIPRGSLVILPEMAATGFSMNIAATTEPPGGPTEQFLTSLARTYHACVLGGMVAEWQGAPRNQAVAVAPDGTVLARYTKQQPFTPAGEATTYPAGHQTVVFDWAGFRIAPFICYDLRFPELFRRATAAGATFFAVIANWPSPRHHHWRTLLAARAIENLAATAGVNRAGQDPNHTYAGGSVALDAQGRPLAEADDRACVLTVALDPDDVAAWRRTFPALRDAGLSNLPTPGAS